MTLPTVDINTVKGVSEQLGKLLNFQKGKRDKIFEELFQDSMNEMRRVNDYFISEITILINALKVYRNGNLEKSPDDIIRSLTNMRDEISSRRYSGRSKRVELFKRINQGRAFDFYKKSFFTIFSDDERIVIRDYFDSIKFYFTPKKDEYCHGLVHSLDSIDYFLSSVERKPKIGIFELQQEIDITIDLMSVYRNVCIDNWSIISTKFYRLENVVKFK